MKLTKIKDEFYFFSGKSSEQVRQLAIVGFAIVWLIKPEHESFGNINSILFTTLLLLTITLAIDILQYFYGTVVWGVILIYQERKKKEESDDVKIPSAVNVFTWICFIGKVISLVASYAFLLWYVISLS